MGQVPEVEQGHHTWDPDVASGTSVWEAQAGFPAELSAGAPGGTPGTAPPLGPCPRPRSPAQSLLPDRRFL